MADQIEFSNNDNRIKSTVEETRRKLARMLEMTNKISPARFIPEILILDDDPIFRDAFQDLLSWVGFTARVTGSETEAFNILATPGVRVLVQNFSRENGTMGGCQLTAALRENPATRETPVILMTSTENRVIRKAFRESNLDLDREITAILRKPETMEDSKEAALWLRALLEIEL